MKKPIAIAALTMGLAIGISASGKAQDISADPISDTVSLSAGFTPDPTTVAVTSGGTVNAGKSIDGCSGYISDAPDLRLTFSANQTPSAMPLYINAKSSGDTTLVINAPDGRWYCNDDSAGSNPMVVFGPAQSGNYEIWVGSFEEGEYHDATLEISELNGE